MLPTFASAFMLPALVVVAATTTTDELAGDHGASSRRPYSISLWGRRVSFAATTTDGQTITEASAAEGPIILDFFAPNCRHSQRQLPKIEAVRKTFESRGCRFYYVAERMRQDFEQEAIDATLAEWGIQGSWIHDEGNQLGQSMKVNSFPTLVVLDYTGIIDTYIIGNKPDVAERLIEALTALAPEHGRLIESYTSDLRSYPTTSQARHARNFVSTYARIGARYTFDMVTTDGEAITETSTAEGPIVLNFFAPSCPHSQRQLRRVETIRSEWAPCGYRFINIAEQVGCVYEPAVVTTLLEAWDVHGPTVVDADNDLADTLHVVSYPTIVVLDTSGAIAAWIVGDIPTLENELTSVLAEGEGVRSH